MNAMDSAFDSERRELGSLFATTMAEAADLKERFFRDIVITPLDSLPGYGLSVAPVVQGTDISGTPRVVVTAVLAIADSSLILVRGTTLVDTTSTNPTLPVDGTKIVIGTNANGSVGILSIGGFSVDRTLLEGLLGFAFDWYVNEADGKTLLYGLGYDRRAQGGTREQVGLAGGTIDDNSIVIESYSSTKMSRL